MEVYLSFTALLYSSIINIIWLVEECTTATGEARNSYIFSMVA